MSVSLAGHVVVVVGGTTGLGLSAARAWVAGGGRVVVVGRNRAHVDEAVAELGAAARGWCGDAAQPDTASRAIVVATEAFGQCDGLYHVAGGSGRRLGDGPLHAITDDGWMGTLQLNLTSMMYSNRAAVRHWVDARRGGVLLNMGSVLGWSASPEFFATHGYAAAKAAIIGFTRSIAAYYAPQNIRANVLAPGLVETPMAQRAANDATIKRFIALKQPLDGGRIGRPDDCDGAAVYLLSEAARFVTGQVLAVDGGWSVSEGRERGT